MKKYIVILVLICTGLAFTASLPSAGDWNWWPTLQTWLLTTHNADGTHKGLTLTDANVVSDANFTFNSATYPTGYWDATNGQFRVGESVTLYDVLVDVERSIIARVDGGIGTMSNAKIAIQQFRDSGNGFLAFDRSRGTYAAQTELLSGDILGSIVGVGYNENNALVHGPEISMLTTGNWSGDFIGSGFRFYGAPATGTSQIKLLEIAADGTISVVVPNTSAKFGVGIGDGATPDSVGHFKGANQFILRVESSAVGSVTTIQGPSTTGTYDFADSGATIHHKLSMDGGATTLNAEGGSVSVAGIVAYSQTPQTLTGAGTINATTAITEYVSNGGAQALTIANGTIQGQQKQILHITDGGSGVLTGANLAGTSVTFTDDGEACTLSWSVSQTKWFVVGTNAVFAP